MEDLSENLLDSLTTALPISTPGSIDNEETSTTGEENSKEVKNVVSKGKSKMDRKNARKSSKMSQVVAKQVGIKLSSEPNVWLVVWGIGVANCVGKERVLEYFRPKPVEVRLFVDQTYLVIRCATENDAVELQKEFHGKSYDERQTLYVGFIEKQAEILNEDQKYLKPFEDPLPEGLVLIPNFTTLEEEETIIKALYVEESTGSQLKKRTVQHFGYEFRYGTNDVDYCSPLPYGIPDYIIPIVKRMISTGAIPAEPDQLTVNQYEPGQGIPPHCDTHSCFEGPIVSLSLGADIVMDFRQDEKIRSLVLPARGLLVMNDSSRYGWTHGITPRKWDIIPDKINGGFTVQPRLRRISLTFRRLRRGEPICRCLYPNLCDTQKGRITSENASTLENDLVHKVYEEIASHFTETRHKPWPRVKKFVENLSPGDRLLDVGCANGKYFGINKNILEIGNDMSLGLLMKCHEKGHEVIRANALSLPFPDNYFEAVISIAVLHHIATKERRICFVQEVLRVLAPHGSALIYVWAKEQRLDESQSTWSERQSERNPYNTPDICAKEVSPYSFLPVHDRALEFPENDMLVPWVNKQEKTATAVHHRYYHVFTKGELESLVMDAVPPPKIIDSYYEQGNWVVTLQKS